MVRRCGQVELSLRPSTISHIEHDLREFSTWLAENLGDVASCAELTRDHIEAYKTWVSTKHGHRTDKPLARISIKNRLTTASPSHPSATPSNARAA